ncbi:hypothetical protein AHAS_Ahas15G0381000 [Arachis hypogaea]
MPLSMRRRDVGSAAERATPDVGVPMRGTRIHDDAYNLGFSRLGLFVPLVPVFFSCTYLGCTALCQNMHISRTHCIRDALLFISRVHP